MPKVWLQEAGVFYLHLINETFAEPTSVKAGGILHKYRWISYAKDGRTESGEKEIYIQKSTTKISTFDCLCRLVNAWNAREMGYCGDGRTWVYIAIS